jgi:hypothetical protein
VVKKAIEKRAGEGCISEDLAPVREVFVARDHGRMVLVALAQQLEEPSRSGFVEFDVTEFVDYEQGNVVQMPLLMPGYSVELSKLLDFGCSVAGVQDICRFANYMQTSRKNALSGKYVKPTTDLQSKTLRDQKTIVLHTIGPTSAIDSKF